MSSPNPDPTGPSDPIPPVPDPTISITEALPVTVAALGSDVTLALSVSLNHR